MKFTENVLQMFTIHNYRFYENRFITTFNKLRQNLRLMRTTLQNIKIHRETETWVKINVLDSIQFKLEDGGTHPNAKMLNIVFYIKELF